VKILLTTNVTKSLAKKSLRKKIFDIFDVTVFVCLSTNALKLRCKWL